MKTGWIGAGLAGMALPLLFSLPAVAEDGEIVLAPSSAWQVDYADESCALRRAFGTEENRATLEIMQQAPGAYFRVTLTSNTFGLSSKPAKVRFEPDNFPQIPPYLLSGPVGDGIAIAFTDSLRPNVPQAPMNYIDWTDEERDERESAVTRFSVRDGFDHDVALITGPMHAPMSALRTCMKDLYSTWDVDLDAHKTLLNPASPRNDTRVSDRVRNLLGRNDIRISRTIPVVVRVIVGTDGLVSRCRVFFATWADPVSAEICGIVVSDSRYSPARNKDGEPITSFSTLFIGAAG